MTDLTALKERATAEVARWTDRLLEVSHDIHAHPELCFEEHHAHEVLTAVLAEAGLAPERGAFGVPTAFRATAGASGPVVAVLCEYDALPGIGHACGHNVIAAAGLGAGLALAAVAAEAGGRVAVLGTPAEEGGGGKIVMERAGAFDGVDAAMMIHPADADLLLMSSLAIQTLDVTYEGRAAHAAAAPWKGRNALDAAVLGYVNVAALRQHITPEERVHGVLTEAGEKPNIVPRRAAAQWYVRSPSAAGLEELKARVLTCLHAGAEASGCTMQHTWDDRPYLDVRDNEVMMAAFAANAAALGRPLTDPRAAGAPRVLGSTDMGNVSYRCPSIHPMLQVAPSGVAIHTPEFAAHAVSAAADRAVVDGALAMAHTAIDLWCTGLLADAKRSFSGA